MKKTIALSALLLLSACAGEKTTTVTTTTQSAAKSEYIAPGQAPVVSTSVTPPVSQTKVYKSSTSGYYHE